MMKRSIPFLISAALLFFAACSEPPPLELIITGSSGGRVHLTGNWFSCIPDGSGNSYTISYAVTEDFYAGVFNLFPGNTGCTGSPALTRNTEGNLVLDGELEVPFGAGGSLVMATTTSSTDSLDSIELHTPAMVSLYNASPSTSGFGFSDWAVHTPKDVLGLDETGAAVTYPELGLLYVDDLAASPTLYFEDDTSPLDINGYPSYINPNIYVVWVAP